LIKPVSSGFNLALTDLPVSVEFKKEVARSIVATLFGGGLFSVMILTLILGIAAATGNTINMPGGIAAIGSRQLYIYRSQFYRLSRPA